MRTELQRQTSRLNGAKSRGPRTAAGKRRSSQNACRHGLYSRSILSEEVRQALGVPSEPAPVPATAAEAAYLLAHLEHMHITALETRIFSDEIERQRTLHPGETEDLLLLRAWQHLCRAGIFQALCRLMTANFRRLHNAVIQLKTEWTIQRPRAEKRFRETNPAPETGTRNAVCTPPVADADFYGTNPAPAAPVVSSRSARSVLRQECRPRSVICETNPSSAQVPRLQPAPALAPAAAGSPLHKRGPPGQPSSSGSHVE